jgi:hypothetical protein
MPMIPSTREVMPYTLPGSSALLITLTLSRVIKDI